MSVLRTNGPLVISNKCYTKRNVLKWLFKKIFMTKLPLVRLEMSRSVCILTHIRGSSREIKNMTNYSRTKNSFMLLNYISSEQSVKILVTSLKNCKSYEHLHYGVSAFTEQVENQFAMFFVEGWLNVLCAISFLEP